RPAARLPGSTSGARSLTRASPRRRARSGVSQRYFGSSVVRGGGGAAGTAVVVGAVDLGRALVGVEGLAIGCADVEGSGEGPGATVTFGAVVMVAGSEPIAAPTPFSPSRAGSEPGRRETAKNAAKRTPSPTAIAATTASTRRVWGAIVGSEWSVAVVASVDGS